MQQKNDLRYLIVIKKFVFVTNFCSEILGFVIHIFSILRLSYYQKGSDTLKFPKLSVAVIRKIVLSLLVILVVYIFSNHLGGIKLIRQFGASTHYTIHRHEHSVIYRIKKTDCCASCQKHHFLVIDGQKMVVRRGTPFKPGPISEIIQINVAKLPNSERKDLNHGIPFVDEKEKLQIIESLNELMAD